MVFGVFFCYQQRDERGRRQNHTRQESGRDGKRHLPQDQGGIEMKNTVCSILKELTELVLGIRQEEMEEMADQLCRAYKKQPVFLDGAGRSRWVVRAFANRLMDLGFECYLAGDMTAPALKEQDLWFILTGSGKTDSLALMAQTAQTLGARTLVITCEKDSPICRNAETAIILPGTTGHKEETRFSFTQPAGSCFEQLSWLVCDGLVLLLEERLGVGDIKHNAYSDNQPESSHNIF